MPSHPSPYPGAAQARPYTVYARYEPTTDAPTLAYCSVKEIAGRRDVALYANADATGPICRWGWHRSSKPTRRNRRVTINCFTRPLVWLPDHE